MKKGNFLVILGLSAVTLAGCDFIDSLPIIGNNVKALTKVSKSKQKELIDSVKNIAFTEYFVNMGDSKDYSKESVLEKIGLPMSKQVLFPDEKKQMQGPNTTYQIIDDKVYLNGEPYPEDDPLYGPIYEVLSLNAESVKAEHFTFSAIDKMWDSGIEAAKQYFPSLTVSVTGEEFAKNIKIKDKKDKTSFTLVYDDEQIYKTSGMEIHVDYLSVEYKDYMLVGEIIHEWVDYNVNVYPVTGEPTTTTSRLELTVYEEISYNVNPSEFYGS